MVPERSNLCGNTRKPSSGLLGRVSLLRAIFKNSRRQLKFNLIIYHSARTWLPRVYSSVTIELNDNFEVQFISVCANYTLLFICAIPPFICVILNCICAYPLSLIEVISVNLKKSE